MGGIEGVGDSLGGFAQNAGEGMGDFAENAGDWMGNAGEGMGDFAGNVGEGIGNLAEGSVSLPLSNSLFGNVLSYLRPRMSMV